MRIRTALFGLAMVFVTLLVSCIKSETGGISPAVIGLEGIEWQLMEVGGIPVSALADGRRPFVNFDAAKQEAVGYWAESPDTGPEGLRFRLQATLILPKLF